MKFYITPDKREECEKKINRMFKKFVNKPSVTYSEVQKVIKYTVYDWGYDGLDHQKMRLDAIEVEIEDIRVSEWTLVATVLYYESIVTMCNSKLFKSMPKQFGLDYDRCDYCGGHHKGRKESHVLYNNVTGKWMQVGSSCVNKMIDNGKYLASITLNLFKVIKMLGGCDEFGWEGGCWKPADNYWKKAIHYSDAISCAAAYIEENGDIWIKTKYENREKIEGTNDFLQAYYSRYKGGVDDELVGKVTAYLNALVGGYDYYGEPDFNQKMKSMVENEYIILGDFFLAFFAVKGYYQSIKAASFVEYVKTKGVEVGKKISFEGVLVDHRWINSEMCYYPHYEAKFKGNDGMEYRKDFSDMSVLDAYKCDDDTYRFNVTVKYIATKNQYVGLGGRLSKFKKIS